VYIIPYILINLFLGKQTIPTLLYDVGCSGKINSYGMIDDGNIMKVYGTGKNCETRKYRMLRLLIILKTYLVGLSPFTAHCDLVAVLLLKLSKEYSSHKGGAISTMFSHDGKEDLDFRILHVYEHT
jgi:hypothetical protein